jgi:hypothetical protein
MWPFDKKKKQQYANPNTISFSQTDITESVGDNLKLKPEDWITTIPLNLTVPNPEASNLPAKNASPEKIYEIATTLSKIREQISIPSDGVYCPVCHHANIQLQKLHTPCPQCGRALLKFGWN